MNDDLLRELPGRVVELLGADTAAVLLLDEPSEQPVAARRDKAAGLVGNNPTANPPSSKPNCYANAAAPSVVATSAAGSGWRQRRSSSA